MTSKAFPKHDLQLWTDACLGWGQQECPHSLFYNARFHQGDKLEPYPHPTPMLVSLLTCPIASLYSESRGAFVMTPASLKSGPVKSLKEKSGPSSLTRTTALALINYIFQQCTRSHIVDDTSSNRKNFW